MKIDLSKRNALVLGSSDGLGLAVARQFADCGANLLLVARSKDKLERITEELKQKYNQHIDFLAIDIGQLSNLRDELQKKLTEFGNFTIVLNNSGGPPTGLASETTIEDFEQAFRQQLYAFQVVLHIVKPGMIELGFGRIINITSIGAKQPIPNLGVSNTLRGAVTSWAKTLSRELGPYGITVNNILPGFILTQRLISLINTEASRKGISFEHEMNMRQSQVPVGRIGKPEEIAYAAAFLASDYAGYVNGINFPVDGGFLSCV